MKNSKKLMASLLGLTVFVILALGSEEVTSKANGQASGVRCTPDSKVVDGELDYGIAVTLTVKNNGEAGIISVTPKLSTSEGEWSRTQKLQFAAGESRTLTYFFEEPTINATNIQCRANVSP